MDIYVIPPTGNLGLMNLGDRFFCLAQLYKENPLYREFFRQKVRDGKWVTLDNGAGDHNIVGMEDLLWMVEDLEPSEVIPPDILFDGIKTISNFHYFLNRLEDKALSPEIFAVPQGRDQNEWLFVYEYFLRHETVCTIGLSKIAVPKAFMGVTGDKMIKEARHFCYDKLKGKDLIKKPIHLLGLGDPTELAYYKNDPLIRSNDSCNSIWSGMNNISWSHGDYQRIPTPKDYFDRTMTTSDESVAIDNINWLRNLVK